MRAGPLALLVASLARGAPAAVDFEGVARASITTGVRACVERASEPEPGGVASSDASARDVRSDGSTPGSAQPGDERTSDGPSGSAQSSGSPPPSDGSPASAPSNALVRDAAQTAPAPARQEPPKDAEGGAPDTAKPPAQDPPPSPLPQETPVTSEKPVAVDPPVVKDVPPAETATAVPKTEAPVSAIASELRALVAAHPTRARLETYGTSRAGEELVALAVGEGSAADVRARPAVLVVAGLEPLQEKSSRGPAGAVELARTLLERAERDPAYAAQFQRATLYVVADADPDAREGRGGARACRIDRNFPSGWRAWQSADCPQGPYPLSEPETRALAKLALDRAQIAGVLELARVADVELASAKQREPTLLEPRLALGAQSECAPPLELGANVLEREPGAFAAFARSRAGAGVVRFDVERCPDGGRAAAEIASRLLAELPVLAVRVRATERLRDRLWLVRASVENSGLVPTLGPEARAGRETSAWFGATNARVLAASIQGVNGAEHDLRKRGERWFLGHLDGGERRELALVLEGEPGARVTLEAGSLRGGVARAEVVLE